MNSYMFMVHQPSPISPRAEQVVNITDNSGGPVQQRPGTTSLHKATTDAAPKTGPWTVPAVLALWLAMGM